MSQPSQPAATPPRYPNRWWILSAVLVVLLMAPLDASAVNVILPVLQRAFGIALSQVAWVALVYLLVITSLILPMGRLGDLFGFRRFYLLGAVVFIGASLLCGMAPTFAWLIGARILQGIGACMLMALSPGIITALFPANKRGRALGTLGTAIATGLVIGPTLGGWLTDLAGWRWIFFINLPIGLLGGVLCYRLLPPIHPGTRARIDWSGAFSAILMLGTLMLAVTQGESWGWASPAVLGLFAISLASAVAFAVIERRSAAPMLDFALFRHPVFAGANLALVMNFLGQFSALFLVPKLLQDGMGLSPARTGLVMIALPASILVLAPISGALSDRIGTRLLATAGESLIALGLVGLAWAAPLRSLPGIIAAMALIGIGAGLFQSPNSSAIMGSVPRTHLGIGGGVLATMRNLGMALGIALSSAVATIAAQHYLERHPGLSTPALLHGIQLAFLTGACFVALGALTSAVRADNPR
ncbi:MAG: MFS transporter [Armatimonadota bacterium]